jgi:hypothetical protein
MFCGKPCQKYYWSLDNRAIVWLAAGIARLSYIRAGELKLT